MLFQFAGILLLTAALTLIFWKLRLGVYVQGKPRALSKVAPRVDILIVTCNEEVILPQLFEFYRARLKNCHFHVFDNGSSDATVAIAAKASAYVHFFDTGGFLRDDVHCEIKNHRWKHLNSDWVIAIDADEFLDVNDEFLSATRATLVIPRGYQMVGDSLNIGEVVLGVPDELYSKPCCFRPQYIREIAFRPGAHKAKPRGQVVTSQNEVSLYHFKWISLEYVLKRSQFTRARLSELNKSKNWGNNYLKSDDQIRSEYADLKSRAQKV